MRSALCRAWRIVNLKNCRLLILLDEVLSGSHKALQNLATKACSYLPSLVFYASHTTL